jgi:hypothetical protein
MDSPNSLLIGFFTLLSYSYCQRHTVGSVTLVRPEKRKEKIFSFFFQCQPIPALRSANNGSFPAVFFSQIQIVPIRTCVCCLLCWGKEHAHIGKNTGSRLGKRLLLKGISHKSQKPFLTDGSGYKKDLPFLRTIAFLYWLCEASTVFLKTSWSLSWLLLVSKPCFPRCCCGTALPLRIVVRAGWFNWSNKSLEVEQTSDRPYCVLCHSSCLIHCRSPTPSVFYFDSNSGWPSANSLEAPHRLTGYEPWFTNREQ